ncbi:hypothetical protein DMUE_6120, partial [Dictyocoela muelleri]
QNKTELRSYFQNNGLLMSMMVCGGCNNVMRLTKYKRNIDGVAFTCQRKNCQYFKKYINIRRGTFFGHFKVDLCDVVTVLYHFFFEKGQSELLELGISHNTIHRIYSAAYSKISEFIVNNPVRLGGEGIICQIDESMFHYRQKYHRGRLSQAYRWVFGIVDTSFTPGKFYVKAVPDRRAETLLPIINSIVRDGTIIWSDQWPAYRNISERLSHETVNHRLYFVDPQTGTNTQHVESLWNKLKYKLKKMMGVSSRDIQDYLDLWTYKSCFNNQDFILFLRHLNL